MKLFVTLGLALALTFASSTAFAKKKSPPPPPTWSGATCSYPYSGTVSCVQQPNGRFAIIENDHYQAGTLSFGTPCSSGSPVGASCADSSTLPATHPWQMSVDMAPSAVSVKGVKLFLTAITGIDYKTLVKCNAAIDALIEDPAEGPSPSLESAETGPVPVQGTVSELASPSGGVCQ